MADSSEPKPSEAQQKLTYGSYLQLDKILSSQTRQSELAGNPKHDEQLFITIHQAYELWFKQVLFELNSIRKFFSREYLEEDLMLRIVARFERVIEILKLCVQQMRILETMTPLEFFGFRPYLGTSSGFQSVQFRVLENTLGIRPEQRIKYHSESYTEALSEPERRIVEESEQQPSLLELINRWLERTPGLGHNASENIWPRIVEAIKKDLANEKESAKDLPTDEMRAERLAEIEQRELAFASVLEKAKHDDSMRRGQRRLSHEATKGALLIFFYRHEPRFHLPFKMLSQLQEVDSQMMSWRHVHASLVQRMIGSKAGTGGSSGYQYLRSTVSDRYKVFLDLFNLATFLIPTRLLPPPPANLKGFPTGQASS